MATTYLGQTAERIADYVIEPGKFDDAKDKEAYETNKQGAIKWLEEEVYGKAMFIIFCFFVLLVAIVIWIVFHWWYFTLAVKAKKAGKQFVKKKKKKTMFILSWVLRLVTIVSFFTLLYGVLSLVFGIPTERTKAYKIGSKILYAFLTLIFVFCLAIFQIGPIIAYSKYDKLQGSKTDVMLSLFNLTA